MKVKEIQELIDFLSQSGLNEVNIETDEFKIHIVREPKIKQVTEAVRSSAPAQAAATAPAATPAKPAEQAPETKTSSASNLVEIKSPMIGTFYRSANPDSPAFVEVGTKVGPGQTVCIVEAMKLFNEIESEISGTIVKVLVENASPVEYDQPLFLVEPN